MNKTVEPTALMSRLMTFVFAGAAALVLILVLAIVRMMPPEKTHVFFLTTTPHDNLEIALTSVPINDGNIDIFRENFVKEYITARNEIFANAGGMQRKWRAEYGGQIFSWSTPAVYGAFANTRMVNAMLNDMPGFEFRCFVNFKGGVQPRSENAALEQYRYAVQFTYSCTDNAGQIMSKDYTIAVTLEMQDKIRWDERLRNPLGVKVTDYTIESGGTDPLDFDWK